MKTYTGATLLRTLLERQGIHTIAGIPGGAILPFYDALHGSRIRHVLARHEQGAGFIAQGMARVTGHAAVCVATSGPGATNLLTAIADARLDSVPLVAITGQVPQPLIGTDAFQEVDTYGLTLPITKHNFLVRSAAELLEVVPLAFQLAESGRPGPVLIDVPKDVLNARIDVAGLPERGHRTSVAWCPDEPIEQLATLLVGCERPVLYLGGGVIGAGAAELARTLAQRLNAPVVATLMALGAMEHDDPLFMGMLGMHGGKGTNLLLQEADLVLAVGARFDDRATGKVAEFCPRAMIAHIDIDRAEIGKIKTTALGLQGDAADILRRLVAQLPDAPARPAWRRRAMDLKVKHPLHCPAPAHHPLHPLNVIRELGRQLPEDAIVTTDVGQHQMWVAQAYPFRQPRTLLTSGGLGTMGFGLPAAIGAALAAPDRRVVCVSGDGSILMNVQELATLAELQLPVAIVLFNNSNLGLVRQQQELFYGGRYEASRFAHAPDFAAVARAFGLRGVRLDREGDPLAQLAAALAERGPCLIDVPIDDQANVYPMVPPGAANLQTITAPELELATAHE
ncbi:biosynthetic-type acetolactate synthase large subunit [Opitutus sp. ER46]|uniref:biosynthetic-type acetolactate synthase large subunit n=1 Tax=Opitutus sp. ER46 TaxID=2161864 RepID=UPI000D31BE3A|nr:biosynthetic-type acetolactate synthase large subunit [Opitutus sp. ER46]PTX91802.1 biosynthetic-type acetolactate synthase large subunit [Opitutus sp. ER46]